MGWFLYNRGLSDERNNKVNNIGLKETFIK